MPLLAATTDALYRVSTDSGTERVLDTGVRQVRTGGGTAYAATADGLQESPDGGVTWRDAGLPAGDVRSVAATETGVLAGVRPLAVHRRQAGGQWTELDGLRGLAADERWPTPSFRDEAWARSVAVDGRRVLVGVEVGGLAVREPNGSWRRAGPSEPAADEHQRCDDIHHVAVRGHGDWLLATGDGVYHSVDAGESWAGLDTGPRRYARELSVDDGVVVGVNDSPPRWRPPDAALLSGAPAALAPVAYPGEPERFAVSFAAGDGATYVGTNDGTVLRVTDASAAVAGSVPVTEHAETAYGVRSLAVV